MRPGVLDAPGLRRRACREGSRAVVAVSNRGVPRSGHDRIRPSAA